MRQARTNDEIEAAMRLRFAVFCEEQGVTLEAEQDGRDQSAVHVVVMEDDRLIGTCRLLIDSGVARLGRMVVSAERRGAGVGSAILEEADRTALAAGAGAIRLNAQVPARGVYDRAGYEAEGAVFMEEGIEHVTMEKRLA
ncbi:MAG: GNAT family N-acetyltransferase [Thermoleophilaceae bacterium]